MYIPKSMKNKIANTFYDKTVEIVNKQTTIDAEGGVTSRGLIVLGSFKGNVSFSNCKRIQEEYGLDYNIDISITSSINIDINMNDLIKYNEVIYCVTDVLKSDSHVLIVATKWRQ